MEGWCSVEELVQYGFGRARVVMANEAHNGLARSIRTRDVGVRMIRAAHETGVRRLAMEALSWPDRDIPGPIRDMPPAGGGYLGHGTTPQNHAVQIPDHPVPPGPASSPRRAASRSRPSIGPGPGVGDVRLRR